MMREDFFGGCRTFYQLASRLLPTYKRDHGEWEEILNRASREDGGIRFAQTTRPVIDASRASTFRPIMMRGSEYDTERLGIETTDFHIFSNDALATLLGDCYTRLNGHSINIHRYQSPGARRFGSVDVEQLIPLSLPQFSGGVIGHYYYLSLRSHIFGYEEFAGFSLMRGFGERFLQTLRDEGWLRRMI